MPRLDRVVFENLSEKTDFQIDVLEKVYRLTELLKEISQTELKEMLVLKGGTAINFLYFDFPRLSVDIDIDYIGSVQKEKMLKDRESLESLLGRLFSMLGYETEEDKAYALQHYDLYYENSAGNRDRVEVEINFLNRVTFLNPVRKKFKHFFPFDNFEVLTLKAEELFGRKLKALVKRTTVRDLYDIYKLLESGINVNQNILKKCFILAYCLDKDPRGVNPNVLNQLTTRDVRRKLLPMLRKGEQVELEEMKAKVRPLLENSLSFNTKEQTFLQLLFEERKYKPEILFEDVNFNKRISKHPGIKWRLEKL